jgi:hypothetical protein
MKQNYPEIGEPSAHGSRYRYVWDPPVVLRKINQRLRADAMNLDGYVKFSKPNIPSFITYPKIDILCIAGYKLEIFESGFYGPSGAVHPMNDIRCLAVDFGSRGRAGALAFEDGTTKGMKKWDSPELVCPVLPESRSFSKEVNRTFRGPSPRC